MASIISLLRQAAKAQDTQGESHDCMPVSPWTSAQAIRLIFGYLLLKEQEPIEQNYAKTSHEGDCQEVHLKGQTLSEFQAQQGYGLRSNPMYWYAEDNAPNAPFEVRTLVNEPHSHKIEHLYE